MRVNGLVGGGFIQKQAPKMAGKTLNGLVHCADWYATFCALAGIDPYDVRAAAAGLPNVDGVNLWPYLSGEVQASPRTQIHGAIDMVINGTLKYISRNTPEACWAGPQYPNKSTTVRGCTSTACERGCLFDLYEDPEERK